MHGQHFHRAIVAFVEIRGGVPEGLPKGARSAQGNREILSVLQLRTIASESELSDAGGDLWSLNCETKRAAKGLWKSRSVEKSTQRTFPSRLEIRKTRGFPLSHSPGGDGYLSFIWKTGEPKTQTRPRLRLTYRKRKMVLTMGSTLIRREANYLGS